MRLLAPPRAPSDLWDLWRARDRRTTTATHRRRAQLDLKSGRRAGKDADRRRLDQVDEPDAQCAPQGRYLRVGHQRDERAHEGESVRVNRTAQQWRNKCASIPLTAQIARPARPTQLTTAGTPQDDRIPTPQPRPSDPAPRRGLALAGVPAPKHAPLSTRSSAFHRSRSLYGRDAKERGRAATAWPCGGPASGTTRLRETTRTRYREVMTQKKSALYPYAIGPPS